MQRDLLFLCSCGRGPHVLERTAHTPVQRRSVLARSPEHEGSVRQHHRNVFDIIPEPTDYNAPAEGKILAHRADNKRGVQHNAQCDSHCENAGFGRGVCDHACRVHSSARTFRAVDKLAQITGKSFRHHSGLCRKRGNVCSPSFHLQLNRKSAL